MPLYRELRIRSVVINRGKFRQLLIYIKEQKIKHDVHI